MGSGSWEALGELAQGALRAWHLYQVYSLALATLLPALGAALFARLGHAALLGLLATLYVWLTVWALGGPVCFRGGRALRPSLWVGALIFALALYPPYAGSAALAYAAWGILWAPALWALLAWLGTPP